jgi:starch phosphorylase
LNEGHAAFAVLERARSFMEATGQPFNVAMAATRVGNLFTTHTAVAAGFDRFDPALIEQYLTRYAQEKLGISVHDLLALGRRNSEDSSEPFNMAYLAIRGCGAVSGVSELHGKVSRHIFQPLFPHWPEDEVPVGFVTNGVHVPTWDSAEADSLWTEACGKDRWLGTAKTLDQEIRRVSDQRLWQFRAAASKALVEYARGRLSQQLAASGSSPESIEAEHSDTRVCAPLCHLQEAGPIATRPPTPAANLEQCSASGATHHSGKGASGGRSRAGLNQEMGAIYPPA